MDLSVKNLLFPSGRGCTQSRSRCSEATDVETILRTSGLWATLMLVVCMGVGDAKAREAPVRLQLKWVHQFQFAGYYAAQTKGFYAEENLRVEIMEGSATRSALPTVLAGEADFGVGDADVVLARMQGQPVVVCAAVFQRSPYIILSRSDRGIRSPLDLVGKTVMMAEDQGAVQFRAMMRMEGIDLSAVTILPHTWDLNDLIEGRVDAVSAYSTVEPAQLRARGVVPSFLRARDYGVDFYGDTLFTTEAMVRSDRDTVNRFVRASMKGWAHAMKNIDETVDYIAGLPSVKARGVSRPTLVSEATTMRQLVLPEVVEVGHMNEARWRQIAETFASQGLVQSPVSLEGFVHDPDPPLNPIWIWGSLGVGVIILVGTGAVLIWTMQMRRLVDARTRELQTEVTRRQGIELALRGSEERLKQAQAIGRMGDWQYDVATRKITWSESLFHLYGRDPKQGEPTPAELLKYFHPDDVAIHDRYVQRALEHGEDCTFDMRIVLPDGRTVWQYVVGQVVRDDQKRVIRVQGIAQDITERKEAETRIQDNLRELERWRTVTLGREERVQAIKQEVNALLAELGRPPRYGAPLESYRREEDAVS